MERKASAAGLILAALVLGIVVGYMIFLPMSPQLETLIRAMAAKPE